MRYLFKITVMSLKHIIIAGTSDKIRYNFFLKQIHVLYHNIGKKIWHYYLKAYLPILMER